MHEASMMVNLMRKIEEVARESGANEVVGVRVKLGALSHFTHEHFIEHFVISSRGTIAEGAVVSTDLSTNIEDPLAHDVILESIEVRE